MIRPRSAQPDAGKAVPTRGRWPAALLCLTLSAPVAAQQYDWSLCGPSPDPAPQLLPKPADPAQDFTRVNADQASTHGKESTTFLGDVVIERGGMRLSADRADYDKESGILNLLGEINYQTPELSLHGDSAHLVLDKQSGYINETRFHFRGLHAFGHASRIEMTDPEHTHLQGATYSTCTPGHQDWHLKAKRLDLDRSTNTGEGRDVSIWFKGVPLIYLPYINFPLEGRKTGLLPPNFGTSSQNGTDISIPYYWNIAPNRDATTTVRNLTARGTMLLGEFRYLDRRDAGSLNVDYLPNDKIYGKDRLFAKLQHQQQLSGRWSANVDYNYASDPNYFNDLGNSLSSTSTTYLERRADLNWQGDFWSFLARAQGYQTLSGTEPYQRLPQLLLKGANPTRPDELHYDFTGEAVRFAHASSNLTTPTGSRIDLTPGVSLPLKGLSWFLTPRLAMRYTRYNLDHVSGETQPSRTLPIASLDSGLYFEREFAAGGHVLQQTLEPRLYYLYVPYRDQSTLPVFDTSALDFNFSQLFRDNRFSGADRVGDANQLTTALTSRLIDSDSGTEYLRGSIGQIFYFQDRKVTLPGQSLDSRNRSDLAGELATTLGRFSGQVSAQWNTQLHETEVGNARLTYLDGPRRRVSFNYRYRRLDPSVTYTQIPLRQADLAMYWPLAKRWRLLARWNYDLEAGQDLETLGGLEYESCCWAIRLVGGARRITSTTANADGTYPQRTDHSIYFTFVLKGLGNFGNSLDSELERGILGYN